VTVYCLVELDSGVVADVSLRALAFARGLGPVAAVVFASPPDVPVADLAAHGVSDVHAVAVAGYAPQGWARAIAALLPRGGERSIPPVDPPAKGGDPLAPPSRGNPAQPAGPPGLPAYRAEEDLPPRPTVVLAAGTDHGNEVMAHLGAITGLPMAANCVSAAPSASGSGLDLVRQRWAGLLLEESELDAPVALLTVATDAVSPEAAEVPTDVTVHEVTPSLADADLVVHAEEAPAGTGGASLATARVVVGGGRGVGSAEGFGPLEELASLLGGVVGVSRVVTSEGWRPHTQQVGQTGTKITPELYLACGISGAIQHIAGCSGARHIIAINTDPAAPMMSRADYAVVGDLHKVIPALIAALRDRLGPESGWRSGRG
jgi:electron transfer flavoprotein alpha subunit